MMSAPTYPSGVRTLFVRGPGHHERSELAARLAGVLAEIGEEVWVRMDVRPRLAADIAGALAVGASRVVLEGEGMLALAAAPGVLPVEPPETAVLVVLEATADPLGVYGESGRLSASTLERLAREGIEVHPEKSA